MSEGEEEHKKFLFEICTPADTCYVSLAAAAANSLLWQRIMEDKGGGRRKSAIFGVRLLHWLERGERDS